MLFKNAFQLCYRQRGPPAKTRAAVGAGVGVSSRSPLSPFVVRNNTVTLPWQPWFAHIVPKSSTAGRTILRLQGGKPLSLLLPKIPAHVLQGPATQKIVTTKGMVTLQPSSRATATTTTMQSSRDEKTQNKTDFELSRQIYDTVSGTLLLLMV